MTLFWTNLILSLGFAELLLNFLKTNKFQLLYYDNDIEFFGFKLRNLQIFWDQWIERKGLTGKTH